MIDNDHYMEDVEWEIDCYLARQKIDRKLLSKDMIDDMAYQYYKNYYGYGMDEEYALRAAVSLVLKENDLAIEGFEPWFP